MMEVREEGREQRRVEGRNEGREGDKRNRERCAQAYVLRIHGNQKRKKKNMPFI